MIFEPLEDFEVSSDKKIGKCEVINDFRMTEEVNKAIQELMPHFKIASVCTQQNLLCNFRSTVKDLQEFVRARRNDIKY